MDTFEFNKIVMAVLGTLFAIFGVSIISEAIFHGEVPEEPAYVLAEVDTGGGGEAEPSGPAFDPVSPLLASADPSAGESEFKKCASCHTVEQGGANKVGPNLWDIVGRDIATVDGFSYSSALQEFGAGKTWSYEDLNGFLWKPKSYVSGTAMGFVGLKDVEDRANVIAYLRTLSGNPVPLPEPESDAASDEGDSEASPDDGAGASSQGNGEAGATGENGASEPAGGETGSESDGSQAPPEDGETSQ